MSAARAIPRISTQNALAGLKIPARSAPPPPSFLLPGLASKWCQRRAFLTRRSTSFWTQSFPPQIVASGSTASFVPSVPPSPSSPALEGARAESSRHGHERSAVDGKRKERKQRYLDSLMEKAGDLSLRCEWARNPCGAPDTGCRMMDRNDVGCLARADPSQAPSSMRRATGGQRRDDTRRRSSARSMIWMWVGWMPSGVLASTY
jgi:hypothetical protein